MKMDAKKVTAIFAKADEMFRKADEMFTEAGKLFDTVSSNCESSEPPPKGEPHKHHIRFRSTNTGNRWKMVKMFARMSASMLFKGEAHLKFNEKPDDKKQ